MLASQGRKAIHGLRMQGWSIGVLSPDPSERVEKIANKAAVLHLCRGLCVGLIPLPRKKANITRPNNEKDGQAVKLYEGCGAIM